MRASSPQSGRRSFWCSACVCVAHVRSSADQPSAADACGFAQSMHRPDAGAAGAGEDRRAVAAGPRPVTVLRRAAGRAAAGRACLGRGRAAPAPGPGPGGAVWRADHARAAATGARPGAARCLAAGFRRHPPDDPPARRAARRAAARRGAARRDGRQLDGAAASGARRACPGLGTAWASPRGPAR